jgi:hypothetical protein
MTPVRFHSAYSPSLGIEAEITDHSSVSFGPPLPPPPPRKPPAVERRREFRPGEIELCFDESHGSFVQQHAKPDGSAYSLQLRDDEGDIIAEAAVVAVDSPSANCLTVSVIPFGQKLRKLYP